MIFLAQHMGRSLDFMALDWIQADAFCRRHGLQLLGRQVTWPNGKLTISDTPQRETRH